MVSTLTLTLQEEAIMRLTYSTAWESILAQALRGATTQSTSGSSTKFTDAFSGMEVTVTSAGGFATGFTITEPDAGATKTLIEADFETGAVTQKAVVDAFSSYLKTSGASAKLDKLLDDLRYDITIEGSTTKTVPVYATSLGGSRHDDIFRLNDSANTVYASMGNDSYFGGNTYDSVSYAALSGGLKMTKSGAVRMIEKPNGDVDTLRNIEVLLGSEGNDNFRVGLGGVVAQIHGGGGNDKIGGGGKGDHLDGGADNDLLLGRGGNDLLIGGTGDDKLNGGGGDDILVGSAGFGAFTPERDDMKGGKGKDLFVLEALSFTGLGGENFVRIRDFKDGEDFLGLIGFDFVLGGTNSDNLVFSDLSIRDTANGAMISHDGNDLALLNKVAASDLTREDFVELVNPFDYTGFYDDFLFL